MRELLEKFVADPALVVFAAIVIILAGSVIYLGVTKMKDE